MPKNIPSLKPKELIKLLEQAGCTFYREGKGDHCLYTREVDGKRRVVPIDMGAREIFAYLYLTRLKMAIHGLFC
ncbi:type II toxin-antitoxin system HicA family toxin [Nostoc sp. CHAB 5836]|uniref:type II toxin-antitoxin system HicA family toxin n=1 Tax=Nostoc sp. CHAB 5836 TaxID=2780404 RepID=UPI001E445ED1|nr:type II toxin-antitoxin system HicA family toxin [Nostoc sp. CHAB 5836]MCC5617212.1 type II toxin-antitoxin system HicA family toxin [Nostoc sp. CHAB 5836]